MSAMIAFRDRYTRAWLCTGACTGTIQRVTPQILIELHQQHCSDYSAGRYRHCYDCLLRYAERASLRELYGPRHDGCPSAPCAPAFRMPAPCLREHQTFQDFCRVRGCTPIGATSLFSILHRFLLSFDDQGIAGSDQIQPPGLTPFVGCYSGRHTRQIATVPSHSKLYFSLQYVILTLKLVTVKDIL